MRARRSCGLPVPACLIEVAATASASVLPGRAGATRLAESLGDEGDKLVKRVLGHSDGSVTAIYNRYGYVKEMRRALEQWASELRTETIISTCCLAACSDHALLKRTIDHHAIALMALEVRH
jgi:hypothetical protein